MCIKINSAQIKSKRVKQGKTQQYMAGIIGININTYCQKENGQSEFLLKEAKIASDDLGESIEDLFFAN